MVKMQVIGSSVRMDDRVIADVFHSKEAEEMVFAWNRRDALQALTVDLVAIIAERRVTVANHQSHASTDYLKGYYDGQLNNCQVIMGLIDAAIGYHAVTGGLQ